MACKKQTVVATSTTEAEYVAAASCCGQAKHIEYLMLKASPLKYVKRGRDTKIHQSSGPPVKVGDEAIHKELGDRMERAANTASSLEAEQDSDAQTSYIKFALTENPTIYTSLIHQFWQTTSTSTLEDGEVEITATIDGQLKTITEVSLRRHLKLEDADGISSLPNSKFFEQLALMGPKKTAWEQFSSNIATDESFSPIHSNPFEQTSEIASTSQKNLCPIQQGEGSTVLVESHHIPITTPSTSQPPLSSPSRVPTPPHDSPLPGGHTPRSDEGSMTLTELTVLCTQLSTKVASLERDLKQTKKVYSNAYTKLIMRVKKLEHKVKSRQPRRRARVVISDTEEDLEDPSKQGRRIAEIDQNPSISLVQNEGTSWIQEDAEIQGRTSADTEILLDQEEPTELARDLGSGEKGEKETSTANISVSTASATPEVSIAAENLVYIRRSAEKRKDKGKAIMKKDESVQKKTKKQLKQERLGHEEAIRLQEQINEEERQRIARDAEIAKHDPAVLRYLALQNRSFSKAERSREDFDEDNAKKQKLKDDVEKKELRDSMDVVPRDDIAIDIESLATKYLIVD
ncbi:hypothetical protein Tco_0811646 [Tanacetum coccineum]